MPASAHVLIKNPVKRDIPKNESLKLIAKTEDVRSIQLTVNGMKCTVLKPDPKMLLNEWLRNHLHLKGTKVLCGEGGCGSCVVAISKEDPVSSPESITAVNSCLFPLLSLNGHHVITVEGLGGKKDGFHVIQKRMAEKFGSQCGFCTPGFIMNGFSLLASAKNGRTEQEMEDGFDGNICRCTGYRPILETMKSFANDNDIVDIEDLRSCKGYKGSCTKAKVIDCSSISRSESVWFTPDCLLETYHIMQQFRGKRLKFVSGNTGVGVFKNEGNFDAYINVNQMKELTKLEIKQGFLEIGSSITLTQLIDFMEVNAEKSESFAVLARHIKKVANVPVRNVATWSGNLMLNHLHKHFPSDIYLMFAAAGACLVIADLNGNHIKCTLKDFMLMQMESKIILHLILPLSQNDEFFQTYKVMPRKQNSYAYVNAGFRAAINKEDLTFRERPTLIFGGVGLKMVRATKVEEFLHEKCLHEESIFQDSLKLLEDHLEPNPENKLVDFDYCKNVAVNLFYKFFLLLRGERISKRLQTIIEPFDRPVSSGHQSFHVDESAAPLNQPCERVEGKLQASGEVLFVDDLPKHPDEAYAAFVLSEVASAEPKGINTTKAEEHPGFLAIITEKDIHGANSFLPGKHTEEIFASKNIEYAGQPVALVVADSQRAANEIAQLVSVEYFDVREPILTLEKALETKNFHPENLPVNIIGNTEAAFPKCDHVITGEIKSGGQHHFYIEPLTCFVVREEHDYKVFSSTQSTQDVQKAVANALAINVASVDVQVTRVGGAFGGKFQYPPLIAAAAATAARSLDRPIRATMTLTDNMKIAGVRPPFLTKYKVGFSKEGNLEACEIGIFVDAGKSVRCKDGLRAALWMDNAYFCPNWKISFTNCKTNKPFSTFFRGPGNLQGIFIIETILDHIASLLSKDTEEIKEINLYRNGQMSLRGIIVSDCLLNGIWTDIQIKSEYKRRKFEIAVFNKEHRWKKRGISLMPLKYDVNYGAFYFSALVSIYYADGTVAVSHSGIEMGQGINSRVRTVAAAKLGIPLDHVSVKPHSTVTAANSWETGASVTSEINCLAVYKCCEILCDRIAPFKEKFPNASWKELIEECEKVRVNLSAQFQYYDHKKYDYSYSVYGAVCSEAEVDVLTGETHILRSDIIYDCGESINPKLDIGQVEGAFVQGMGYWLTEKVAYDQDSGQQLTTSTWDYKPPMSKDIPVDMRVYLLHEAKNPVGFVRSKAVGEPAICMSTSCLFAAKNAVKAAREELCHPPEYFALDGPATINKIQVLCKSEQNRLIFD